MQREKEETAVFDFISHVFRNLKRSRKDARENPKKQNCRNQRRKAVQIQESSYLRQMVSKVK